MKPANLEMPTWKDQENNLPSDSSPLSKKIRLTINLVGIVLTWLSWFWLINAPLSGRSYFWISVVGVLLLGPVVFIARWSLDCQPNIQRAACLAAVVHYLVAIFFGSALIGITRFAQIAPDWAAPLSPWVGLALMLFSGIILIAAAVHLVNKGLGLPLGAEVTRLVVTNWLYAWTRNPIMLSALAFLVGVGLWLQSGSFLLWVLALVFPAMVIFLLVFEEKELEIRFGKDYLDYKRRTPRLWPRRPKNDL